MAETAGSLASQSALYLVFPALYYAVDFTADVAGFITTCLLFLGASALESGVVIVLINLYGTAFMSEDTAFVCALGSSALQFAVTTRFLFIEKLSFRQVAAACLLSYWMILASTAALLAIAALMAYLVALALGLRSFSEDLETFTTGHATTDVESVPTVAKHSADVQSPEVPTVEVHPTKKHPIETRFPERQSLDIQTPARKKSLPPNAPPKSPFPMNPWTCPPTPATNKRHCL